MCHFVGTGVDLRRVEFTALTTDIKGGLGIASKSQLTDVHFASIFSSERSRWRDRGTGAILRVPRILRRYPASSQHDPILAGRHVVDFIASFVMARTSFRLFRPKPGIDRSS